MEAGWKKRVREWVHWEKGVEAKGTTRGDTCLDLCLSQTALRWNAMQSHMKEALSLSLLVPD